MTTLSPVEASLAAVEACLARVGAALQNSEADALQRASEQLRMAAVHFSQALQGSAASLSPAMVVRVRTVSVRLTSQRDALARMSAVVDRQVSYPCARAGTIDYLRHFAGWTKRWRGAYLPIRRLKA
ncbi:MAG: hypothetical protein V9G23_15680 [Giesbergeria sp.]